MVIKKIIKRVIRDLILNDIYKIIFELGGCDALDNYSKGWDDAINAVGNEISRIIDKY